MRRACLRYAGRSCTLPTGLGKAKIAGRMGFLLCARSGFPGIGAAAWLTIFS